MCGIAGEIRFEGGRDAGDLARMLDALVHRGPDSAGVWNEGPAALGHRRLSVIDPKPRSDQPMHDASGRYVMVYNGEIYNFRELRADLEAAGESFVTSGDAEILLAAFRRWGADCLDQLDGMFAFAIWDRDAQQLFAARDRFGEKPLFYVPLPCGGLIFASELRALMRNSQTSHDIDSVSLGRYLACGYTLDERTILSAVRRLPPATRLVARRGVSPDVAVYWDLAERIAEPAAIKRGEALERFESLFRDSVRRRLVADVPLGAFLSGGIDSSLIVAAMAEVGAAEKVRSFSIGFHEKSYSELPKAREVAGALGVDHNEEIVSAEDAASVVAILARNDEPFADTSIVPTHALARFTRRHVTVALSGDGGDELFAGYETYRADRLRVAAAIAPAAVVNAASAVAARALPASWSKVGFDYKLRQFLHGATLDFAAAHWSWRELFDEAGRRRVLRDDWKSAAAHDGLDVVRGHDSAVAGRTMLQRAAYIDIKTWLADDVLAKVDRAAMAHSLETRAPFLDHRVAEFALSLPDDFKLHGARTKRILRESAARRFPSRHAGQKKQGFNAPAAHWMAGKLRDPLFDHARGAAGDVVDPQAVEALASAHALRRCDHGFRLFALLALSVWLNEATKPCAARPTPQLAGAMP